MDPEKANSRGLMAALCGVGVMAVWLTIAAFTPAGDQHNMIAAWNVVRYGPAILALWSVFGVLLMLAIVRGVRRDRSDQRRSAGEPNDGDRPRSEGR